MFWKYMFWNREKNSLKIKKTFLKKEVFEERKKYFEERRNSFEKSFKREK